MSLTQTARHQLLARIIPHKDSDGHVKTGRKTATGLTDLGRGNLLIPPSEEDSYSHTGPLAQLTDEEKAAIGYEEPVHASPVKKTARRQGSRTKPKAVELVRVELDLPGAGVLPSQYAHCYEGKGVLVLGLADVSYVPTQASKAPDGTLQGVVGLVSKPGSRYIFVGNEFKDSDGVRNLILVELPKETGQ